MSLSSHSNLSVGSEEDKEDETDAGRCFSRVYDWISICLVQGYCRLNCKTKGGIGHCNIWKVIRCVSFKREDTLRDRVRQ